MRLLVIINVLFFGSINWSLDQYSINVYHSRAGEMEMEMVPDWRHIMQQLDVK